MSYRVRQFQTPTARRANSVGFYAAMAKANIATVADTPVAILIPSLLPPGTITVPAPGYGGAGGFPIPGT